MFFSYDRLTNEKLLEFFIAVIDTELLEAVGVKDLKAINVKHANDSRLVSSPAIGRLTNGDGTVDFLHYP